MIDDPPLLDDSVAIVPVSADWYDECDRALNARAVGGRVAFGWAGPTASHSLLDAVATADRLLRREADTG